jgi:hypothetical protein
MDDPRCYVPLEFDRRLVLDGSLLVFTPDEGDPLGSWPLEDILSLEPVFIGDTVR